jgi:hypothetical protein
VEFFKKFVIENVSLSATVELLWSLAVFTLNGTEKKTIRDKDRKTYKNKKEVLLIRMYQTGKHASVARKRNKNQGK